MLLSESPNSIQMLPLKVYEAVPGPLVLGFKIIEKEGKIRISCPNISNIPAN